MGEKPMTDPMELVERLDQYAGRADDAGRIAREAAACIREMVEWRPIETAPRDGTPVLVIWKAYLPEVVCAVVMWDGDQWREADDIVSGPTHWLPLPPAPGAET